MSNNCNERLILEIKQGESRGFIFTITQEDSEGEKPIDLTNKKISFTVRVSPYLNVTPIINKIITEEENNDGCITNPPKGEFKINLYSEDINTHPVGEYYVSIYVIDSEQTYSISGEGNTSSILRFCKC